MTLSEEVRLGLVYILMVYVLISSWLRAFCDFSIDEVYRDHTKRQRAWFKFRMIFRIGCRWTHEIHSGCPGSRSATLGRIFEFKEGFDLCNGCDWEDSIADKAGREMVKAVTEIQL